MLFNLKSHSNTRFFPSIACTQPNKLSPQRHVLSRLSTMISLALFPLSAVYATPQIPTEKVETITVTGIKPSLNQRVIDETQTIAPDVSQLLLDLPGASINQNGKVSAIAQYRGLYGDRIAIKLNGHTIMGAGPNAMDTPLSYSPAITTESMQVFRGIAPVSAAIETLGGAILVHNVTAKLTDSDSWKASGEAQGAYTDVNEGNKLALRTNVANKTLGLMMYVDSSKAEDSESGYGHKIKPTKYNKIQSGLDFRWQAHESALLGLSYDYTDTQNSGTPALPMDITSIFSHRVNLDGEQELAQDALTWRLGYMKADHVMDNFTDRENLVPAAYRVNTTKSNTVDFSLAYKINDGYGNTPWTIGFDGFTSHHDATITNPNNAMFEVANFNDIEDTKVSAFAQWQGMIGAHNVSSGLRVTYVEANSGKVSHHMAMMNPNIGTLVDNFNNADRSVDDVMIDLTTEVQHYVNQFLLVSVGLARKERAPTYQERYLWLPLEATSGLADGNTYLGDINLDPEVAYQSNIGLNFDYKDISISADTYYQYIDDYIQGVQATNAAGIMVSSMMGNDNLLQFSNVDARLYGLDGLVNYKLADAWSVQAKMSYVRGKRADINDDLYRIAPFTSDFSLKYQQDNWQHMLRLHAVANQDKVAELNREQETAGYATLHFKTEYSGFKDLNISAGVDNMLDKGYRNHLGGYDRIQEKTTGVRERLPSDGANVWMSLRYQF